LRQEITSLFAYEIGQVISRVVRHGFQPFDMFDAYGNDMPIACRSLLFYRLSNAAG
jgi:hypothetical protein